jgi:hypothetical protein
MVKLRCQCCSYCAPGPNTPICPDCAALPRLASSAALSETTMLTLDEARARAAHYQALANQNIGRLTYQGLLTLATIYEDYVARLGKEAVGKVTPIRRRSSHHQCVRSPR